MFVKGNQTTAGAVPSGAVFAAVANNVPGEFLKATSPEGAGLPPLPSGIVLGINIVTGKCATFNDTDAVMT